MREIGERADRFEKIIGGDERTQAFGGQVEADFRRTGQVFPSSPFCPKAGESGSL
jgi:hypothetical protein